MAVNDLVLEMRHFLEAELFTATSDAVMKSTLRKETDFLPSFSGNASSQAFEFWIILHLSGFQIHSDQTFQTIA
jgi:hypothetical protein